MEQLNDNTVIQMTYGDLRACIRHEVRAEIEAYEQSRKHRKDDMLTEQEAAEYLRVTTMTIRRWTQLRDFPLPVQKIGARNFYRVRDLDARIINQ